jgi:hypothetical protein
MAKATKPAPSTPVGDLERLVKLGELMLAQAARVAALSEELSGAKEALRITQEIDLPELMEEVEMAAFTLQDGTSISVKPEVQCYISEDRRAEAHEWLTEHGFGGLIKTVVSASFGRGEHAAAVEAAEKIGGELSEAVHPATLKSFIKERMAAAASEPENVPPTDIFGIRPFTRAVAVMPKPAPGKVRKTAKGT